jgi:hypothetical protein
MTTNTTAIGRIQAIVLDSARPAGLAEFYRRVLGGEITDSGDDYAALAADGVALAFQRVPDASASPWPGGGRRLHLDVAVPDLDAARKHLSRRERWRRSSSRAARTGSCCWTRRDTRSASGRGSDVATVRPEVPGAGVNDRGRCAGGRSPRRPSGACA